MYDWIGFLAPHFKKLPGIKKGHHFYLNSTYPGEVFVKERANQSTPRQHKLLTAELMDGSFPTAISPSGLSPQRQWYLYEKIREVNTLKCVCEDTRTCTRTRTRTRTHTHTHKHTHTHTHRRTHMYTHTHTHTQTDIHTCMQTNTHTHTLVAADLTATEILYIQGCCFFRIVLPRCWQGSLLSPPVSP